MWNRPVTSDADRSRLNKVLIELDKDKFRVQEQPRYSYEEQMGGTCVELFRPDKSSLAFMQGEEAAEFVEQAEKIEASNYADTVFKNADAALDYFISQYDC